MEVGACGDGYEAAGSAALIFHRFKSYVFPAFAGMLAINLLGNIDMILAKHNLDSVLAGGYGALNVISKIIFFVTGVAWLPCLSLWPPSMPIKKPTPRRF